LSDFTEVNEVFAWLN